MAIVYFPFLFEPFIFFPPSFLFEQKRIAKWCTGRTTSVLQSGGNLYATIAIAC